MYKGVFYVYWLKKKRIDYLNNLPNVEPFDIEKEYYNLVKKLKEEKDTIFVPFQLKKNNDMFYNKTISFLGVVLQSKNEFYYTLTHTSNIWIKILYILDYTRFCF